MFERSDRGLRWLPGSRRRERITAARLGVALALSVLVHAGLSVMRWPESGTEAAGGDATVVDLALTAGDAQVSPQPEAGSPAAPPPAPSGQTPADSPPEPAAGQARDLSAQAEARVATLEAARAELEGHVESLTSEKADLSQRLTAERERATELERQLEAAREAERARIARVQADYDALVAALQGEIADKAIALGKARERLTVTITDRVLFPSGQATLTAEGRQTMARVAEVLAKAGDRRILVEGHTDDVPIGPDLRGRFPSNWELSSARATEVVRFLSQSGVPVARLRASGRADTDPIAGNDTDEGRSKNRRIQIILLPPNDSEPPTLPDRPLPLPRGGEGRVRG